MTVSGDLKENAIEFYRDDARATGSFSQGRYITRIKKLAEEYPDECQIVAVNDDSSIVAHFPVKWIKIYPGHGRELTEEEKIAGAERLRAYREKKNMS